MESPVRICLGAVLVVNLLLLSTTVRSNALPTDVPSNTLREDRELRQKTNITWTRSRSKTTEMPLKDLSFKESSEENTDKNGKYKNRGTVKFHTRPITESYLRRVRSTESTKLVIVTPTPEVKKPAEIIDSMRTYKKTKMPTIVSSTSPMPIQNEVHSTEEEFEDEEDEEEKESFEKFTSSKFHDSSFFTLPSFDFDDTKKEDYSSPSYGYSSFFPKESSYDFKDNTDSDRFNLEGFFDFDTELTTPRNDFFDKKFKEISGNIIKNLDAIKVKSPPPNVTNVHKTVNDNIGLQKLTNNTPTNKSTVFIKNTKEIRLSDNEGADSTKTHLSDVQGTSIYYEMSVLSTETYVNHFTDDECDNDTLIGSAPTVGTSLEKELAPIKSTQPTLVPLSTKESVPDSEPDSVSTLVSLLPVSSVLPIFNASPLPVSSQNSIPYVTQNIAPLSTQYSIPYSTQNSFVSTTDKSTRIYSSSYNRNRSYSKRLNLNGVKDPNSVTINPDGGSNELKLQTRKFHHTTPKSRPIWMLPPRNVTKVYTRPTNPTTIYSEHFNIKHKFTTTQKPNRTILTTVSSEIDPVFQSEIGGIKKIVHSKTVLDNSIPSLMKRGSTKFATSTATSTIVDDSSDLDLPPTLAFALATLKSLPPSPSTMTKVNLTLKTVDENELQKVGDFIENKQTTASTMTTTMSSISNDIIPKIVTEVVQNKLQQVSIPSSTEVHTEIKPETQSTRHNVNTTVLSSSDSVIEATEQFSTEETKSTKQFTMKTVEPLWIPIVKQSTTKNEIPTVDAARPIGFESITKLPSGVTTPLDETVAGSEITQTITENPTTDYEITTIRFSYVPTEETKALTEDINNETETNKIVETTTDYWHPITDVKVTTINIPTTNIVESTTDDWHPITNTKITTIKDGPITTYRPKYIATTEEEEITTIVPETISVIEASSQVIENSTDHSPASTELSKVELTTVKVTTEPTTTEVETEIPTTSTETIMTTMSTTTTKLPETIRPSTTPITTTTVEDTTTIEDTTTVVVEVVTEINTEKEIIITSTTESSTTETPCTEEETTKLPTTSEENSASNEVITQKVAKTTEATTTVKYIPTRTEAPWTTVFYTTTEAKRKDAKIYETTTEVTTENDYTTKTTGDLEDLTSYDGEVTTEKSPIVLDEAGSGAAIAIAVSTIGVIALVLLIGLLLVVRRRGRRGIYAQRCTPVSLDAYSLDSVSVGHRKGNHRLRASKRSYGNPAYDDEVTSHPMQYPALANFALDMESMTAEFAEIPSVTVRPEEVPPGCEDKNRYSNVLPLPETRVPLARIGSDPTTEYINANYITGPGNIRNYYIACQAPLSNTVVDFWRMIWEQNSRLVVMLTEYMENGVEKCYEYLPPSEISDNKRTFGEFKIILKKREHRDKYAVSSVQLINLSTRTWREVTHLWYFWPAKGVPDDYDSVIDFLSDMRSYMKVSQTAKEYDEEGVEVIYGDQNRSSFSNLSKLRSDENNSGNGVNVYSPAKAEELMRRHGNNGTLGRMKAASEIEGVRPCVVTCASGAGRSAALVALDICARALAAGSVDVPRVVRHLRAQRPHSLSNRHHYIFVYKVLSEYGNKLMGGGVDTI
ncbi:hypothetical protein K1T71_009089 [Dendrolimus kikuchii]|uniref:Uncharacterized protein n=1 Tax=Dendrolimus kikuchii TaxID=765133 RepID=A0ACC1CTG9_9NEOP|nr:hypothetical protein K1T71_009089 [Dendrolimus kikuchii]